MKSVRKKLSPATTRVSPMTKGQLVGASFQAPRRLTQRVKDDASFHNQDADNITVEKSTSLFFEGESRLGPDLSLHDALSNVLDKEREKDAGHQDSRCSAFIAELTEALIVEHEGSVSE